MITQQKHPAWMFILFPATAMLLGWGLRGYIGGGPFGAMIPGAFVAMCLSLLLGHRPSMAAGVALFGAIGIGFGGNMTYGQTLGLAIDPETFAWGMLGVTLKGAVWGLLGGAMMGWGLTHDRYSRKNTFIGLLIVIVVTFIGIKLINEPKLLYFSNPHDKPRGESWAGFLLAAIALLSWLCAVDKDTRAAIPLRFALWGCIGGGIGFGGGVLWLVYGPSIPVEQKWFGWWKMMEFSFGFLFGGALGWAAHRNCESLEEHKESPALKRSSMVPLSGIVGYLAAMFLGYALLIKLAGDSPTATLLGRNLGELLFEFTSFGAVCIALSLRSRIAAWHVAITITFFHSLLDLSEDLVKEDGLALPMFLVGIVLIVGTIAVAIAVNKLYQGENSIQRLYLLLLWTCFGVATARSSMGFHASIILVHLIFTVSAIITTWFILTQFADQDVEPIDNTR